MPSSTQPGQQIAAVGQGSGVTLLASASPVGEGGFRDALAAFWLSGNWAGAAVQFYCTRDFGVNWSLLPVVGNGKCYAGTDPISLGDGVEIVFRADIGFPGLNGLMVCATSLYSGSIGVVIQTDSFFASAPPVPGGGETLDEIRQMLELILSP